VIDEERHVIGVLRMLLADTCRIDGFTDPAKALAKLERGNPYDIILCDVQMQKVTGLDVYHRLQASRPNDAERVVFLSRRDLSPPLRAALTALPNPVIEKPFVMDEVRRVVMTHCRRTAASADEKVV